MYTLLIPNTKLMPKRTLTPPVNDFGRWMEDNRTRRGWSMESLAADAGTDQSLLSLYKSGRRNPSRDMVQRLAAAFVGEDTDEMHARQLLNEGLLAAGFAPVQIQSDDPLRTVVRKAGYDDQQFSGEDYEKLAEGFETLIAGVLARKKAGRE